MKLSTSKALSKAKSMISLKIIGGGTETTLAELIKKGRRNFNPKNLGKKEYHTKKQTNQPPQKKHANVSTHQKNLIEGAPIGLPSKLF